VLLATFAMMMFACGHAHVRVNMPPAKQADFSRMQLGEVLVASPEEAAKTNAALQEKMRGWRALAQDELTKAVARTGTTLVQDPNALVLTLTSEVRYGNRALRWAVGFGAGAGGVRSVLVARDPRTQEARFQAAADSDLAVGAAGGSIDKVFRKNLTELLTQYERAMKQRS
jgi:hypothetical protein